MRPYAEQWVIDIHDWGQEIKVAAESRESDDFLIVARTDARAMNGLDDALRRSEVAANAGADIFSSKRRRAKRKCVKSALRLTRPS